MEDVFPKQKEEKIRYITWLAVTWRLWGARNNVVFKGKVIDVETIFNKGLFFRVNGLRKERVETLVFILHVGLPRRLKWHLKEGISHQNKMGRSVYGRPIAGSLLSVLGEG